MKMQKYVIEMTLPSDVDSSDLLERMQAVAKELAAEFAPEDDEGEPCEPDEDAIENEVSVQEIKLDKVVSLADFYPSL